MSAASASVAKSRERRVTAGRRIDDEYIHGEDIEEVSIGDITLLVLKKLNYIHISLLSLVFR